VKKSTKIGLGTAAIGRPQYINIKQKTGEEISLETFRNRGIKMLEASYAQGIRYFDTAPGYGLAENLLIEWLEDKNDESIEIATKWGYTYTANFDPNAIQHEVKEHSLNKLNEQWKQSQKLLPFLSTYQIHSATFDTGVLDNKEVLQRLFELKQRYRILIGLTSTGANQHEVLKRALDVEVASSQIFDVFQFTYNIFDQSLATIAKEISNRQKRVVIKEAMANGRIFPNDRYPHYSRVYDTLSKLAQTYEVGIDAIALRFCLDSIPIFKVLSGAANEEHMMDNLKTSTFELKEDEISLLREFSIDPKDYWNERKQLNWN